MRYESKLGYLTAAMVLGLLAILGRFAQMQVLDHDRHTAQAEHMRTTVTLLEPQRADIRLPNGEVVARTESVWDLYLDLERFADPRTLALRAHLSPSRYDQAAVAAFVKDKLTPVQDATLANPSGRRRFFLYWALRREPVMQADLDLCAGRLCSLTGLPRHELDARLAVISAEVDALAQPLGDLRAAPERDVSRAWLRAKPALSDHEHWLRILRFPKSIRLKPMLEARLHWKGRQAEYLAALLEAAAEDPRRLRDLCFSAMQTCRARCEALNPEAAQTPEAQDALVEESASWLRLADLCEQVVRGDNGAIARELARLQGSELAALQERLERLKTQVLERYADDWNRRWSRLALQDPPLLLMKDCPREVVELLKVNADLLPGLVCVRRPARRYEHARELVHVLGAVGLPDPAMVEEMLARPSFGEGLEPFIDGWFNGDHAEFAQRFEGLMAQQLAGVSGVEASYDERLSGLFGARASVRDAGGRVRTIEFEQAPSHREPLTLTIDLELQRDILANVKKWEPLLAAQAQAKTARMVLRGQADSDRWQRYKWSMRGAAVVLDVRTGAVLALASFPDYDPELLAGRTPAARAYQAQLKQEQLVDSQPGYPWWNQKARMFNRATNGLYAPGSTFKVLTALALLDSGTVQPGDTFDEYDTRIMHNGKLLGKTGHPANMTVDLPAALEVSCNGYFYRYSQDLADSPQEAWDNLGEFARRFGFGRPVSTDMGATKCARLPSSERVWAQNLAMLAIGQGELVTTPLEVARFYAAVANRGTLVVPHLCDEAGLWPEQIELAPETWDAVHQGMRRVVEGAHGTARQDTVLKRIGCAGKTGTAENGKGIPDHAWFAGFAPHDEPQVAFVILAANSDLYGADVAPVIGECIERYLQRTGVLPGPVVRGK